LLKIDVDQNLKRSEEELGAKIVLDLYNLLLYHTKAIASLLYSERSSTASEGEIKAARASMV